VKDVERPAARLHEAFYRRAPAGPARSWSTSRRTCSSPRATTPARRGRVQHKTYQPRLKGDAAIAQAVALMAKAKRPIFYTGGGVINSGPEGQRSCCASWSKLTGFPVTSTLMGLGAFPAPIRSGSACSACTAPTKPTWRCMTAT
jgi:acetolactate synthase-1/2/3 large subunit